MSYRLLIIADVRGWAYEKRALALQKYAPDDFEVDITYVHEVPDDLSVYDVVFNIEYTYTPHIKQRLRNQSAKAVLVNSHNADHQRAHERAQQSWDLADYVIFNNYKAWEHFGKRERTCNISNGVDLEKYRVTTPTSQRPAKAIWLGNAGKGLHDILEPLRKKCPNIEFEFRVKTGKEWDPETHLPNMDLLLTDEQMVEWYNTAKYVLCCSETEGTPNYVLEAMACGCVPITTRVGNMLEFKNQAACVYCNRSVEAFAMALDNVPGSRIARERLGKLEIQNWHWKDRSVLFYDLFRRLVLLQKVPPFSYKEQQ